MLIGYQRTSTLEQNLDLQCDALTKAGCERIFSDQVSGAKFDRPGLSEALNFAREGDCICVWRLDRLGRSLQHLIEVVADLESRGVGLRSLTENIDTSSAGGRLVFHVFAAMAEFERNLTRERCLAGLAAARARGKVGGRRQVLTGQKLELAKRLRADRTMPVDEACRILGCSRSTFYKATSE
jgi:DNA invertase Pin-like site-specific DNA recombinase